MFENTGILALFVNEWIKRGMEETGTELKDMLLRNSAGG